LKLLRSDAEYNWKPEDVGRGLFALPDDFVQRMLKKALAVKTFNRCIEMEEHIEKTTTARCHRKRKTTSRQAARLCEKPARSMTPSTGSLVSAIMMKAVKKLEWHS
jgi:hypothetical protein